MNDQQLKENYYYACRVYAENNGGNVRDNFCSLRDDGDGKIYIAEWNHNSPKPTEQQLRAISMSSINNLKNRKKHTKTLQTSKIAMLTKNEIDTVVPEEGMLVYNKTDKNVYVYADGSWKNLLGLLGTIGRIL